MAWSHRVINGIDIFCDAIKRKGLSIGLTLRSDWFVLKIYNPYLKYRLDKVRY